ncbi:MAG: EAL domain-containing protein [Azonexus sp.]|jgi:diguanylate cyclase (GGDEF)-like protein|uniref:putative bifunctional diguanylate cyclase/phosphodiesterase n=1 Tax=Azonexus sp. TaxID=1872668 RepID=UPI002838B7CD|nr:EAL domain-containing protein [Azonexus sp.]MDR0775440.1 EAL domain-containing protein [Azonexus sp.]
MSHAEELRETIVSMQRELDMLRLETTHSRTLLDALDALLVVSGEDDPFASVFSVLLPIFDAALAIALACPSDHDDTMECVASNDACLVGSLWQPDAQLQKALRGRIVATLGSHDLGSCMTSGSLVPGDDQPALYLPLTQHSRRGLLLLLRECGKPGFDRSHVILARKFSLLASHALAARDAHRREIESQRLKQLTDQLTDSQHALAHRANHDQLTGLPNRAHVQELVEERLARKRPGEKLALAFIDVDDFKRVNDIYGHDVGDALLRGIADRLGKQIRANDILGRISGDEFVVILDPFRERSEIVSLVRRISELLHQPFDLDGVQVKGSGSIGVALYPVHGRSYEALRRNADTAMYRAKTSAKGSVEFFNRALSRSMSERQCHEQQLRAAFAARMFRCALQAKVDIRSGRIIGFETLLRWVDAQDVVHAPDTFLPIASELGLLDGITLMQIEELLSWLPQLDQRFGKDIVYSLNISAIQASHPGFMKTLIGRIAQSGRARNFMLELTEESLIRANTFQTDSLPLLREAGIGIAIDDFGTGYSSLAMLTELTVDEIKIDRSFIACIQDRPHQQSILRAIGSLGRALGIDLVAEGIETENELAWLLDNSGIGAGQGFLFHRPAFIPALLDADLPGNRPPLSAITQAIIDRLAKPAA